MTPKINSFQIDMTTISVFIRDPEATNANWMKEIP